jgi:hypothetical protein
MIRINHITYYNSNKNDYDNLFLNIFIVEFGLAIQTHSLSTIEGEALRINSE